MRSQGDVMHVCSFSAHAVQVDCISKRTICSVHQQKWSGRDQRQNFLRRSMTQHARYQESGIGKLIRLGLAKLLDHLCEVRRTVEHDGYGYLGVDRGSKGSCKPFPNESESCGIYVCFRFQPCRH